MAYPYGMKYSTLTFSQPLTVSGEQADRTEITITPTHVVMWADSGRPLETFTETVQAAKGQPGSVTAPVVNQNGFRDSTGATIKGWAYRVDRVAHFGSQKKTATRLWAPLEGQDVVDFDMLPDTSPARAYTVDAPEVLSVAGATGAVGIDYLADRLTPWMDAKVEEGIEPSRVLPTVEAAVRDASSGLRNAVDGRAAAAAASKLDAAARGAANGVASLDAGSKIPVAQIPDAAKTVSGAKPIGAGEILTSIKDYGAKGDGTTSDTAAINTAMTADKTVIYPPGYYPNTTDATFYLYPEMRNYSNGIKMARGIPGKGTTDFRPILQVDKTSNSQRTEGGPSYWDSAIYANLTMEPTSTTFASAITGRVRTNGFGDCVGVTASSQAMGQNGRAWGLWAYGSANDDGTGIAPEQVMGIEVNVQNKFPDQERDGYLPAGEGPYRGITIVTADTSNRCGIGLDIGAQIGSKGWWTGIRLRAGGPGPDGETPDTRAEQLEIQGSSASVDRYTGIRFSKGNFTSGVDLTGGAYKNQQAILLNTSDRVYFGPAANSNYITYDGALFDVRNMDIGVTGKKVIGVRRTGWGTIGSFAGTKTRAGYDAATVTTAQLAERVSALIEDLQTHGLIGA